MFSDTFAGIAPASVPSFILAQLVGAAIAFSLVRTLYRGLRPHRPPKLPQAANAATGEDTSNSPTRSSAPGATAK